MLFAPPSVDVDTGACRERGEERRVSGGLIGRPPISDGVDRDPATGTTWLSVMVREPSGVIERVSELFLVVGLGILSSYSTSVLALVMKAVSCLKGLTMRGV